MQDSAADGICLQIAKRLTAVRLQKTWTRDQLAEQANINVYTLKRFERTGQISLDRLIKICKALDMYDEFERVFKPRQRVSVDGWEVKPEKVRKRGKRRQTDKETA